MNFFKTTDFNFRSVKTVEDVLNFFDRIPDLNRMDLSGYEQRIQMNPAIHFRFGIDSVTFFYKKYGYVEGTIDPAEFIKNALIVPTYFNTSVFELNDLNLTLFKEYFNSTTRHKKQIVIMNDRSYPYLCNKELANSSLIGIIPYHIFSPVHSPRFSMEDVSDVYKLIRRYYQLLHYDFDVSTGILGQYNLSGGRYAPKQIAIKYEGNKPSEITLII